MNMVRCETDRPVQSLGLGVWLRAVLSGLVVAGGVVFVCVLLPFALQLGLLGIVFFWGLLGLGTFLGLVLGIATTRKTLRLARRDAARSEGG